MAVYLTKEQKDEAKRDFWRGMSPRDVAKKFGISYSTAWSLRNKAVSRDPRPYKKGS